MFEADFSACDVHLHNMRSVSLDWLRVWREKSADGATDAQVEATFSIPILWLSGYYK